VKGLSGFLLTVGVAMGAFALATGGGIVGAWWAAASRTHGWPGAEGAAFALAIAAVTLPVAAVDPWQRGGKAAAFAMAAWVPFLVHGAWSRLHADLPTGFAYVSPFFSGALLTLLALPVAPLVAALLVLARRAAIGVTALALVLCVAGTAREAPDPFAFVSAAKPVATLDVGKPVTFPGAATLAERKMGTKSTNDEMDGPRTVDVCGFFVGGRRVDVEATGCGAYEVVVREGADLLMVGTSDDLHVWGRPAFVLRSSTGEQVAPRWVDVHAHVAPPADWLLSSGAGAAFALVALALAAILRRAQRASAPGAATRHHARAVALETFALACAALTSAELAVAAMGGLVF
jgi:hypothetical protein